MVLVALLALVALVVLVVLLLVQSCTTSTSSTSSTTSTTGTTIVAWLNPASTSCSCQDTDWQNTSLILWPHDVFKTLFDAGPAVFFDRLGTPDQWEEYRHFAFLSLGKTTTFPMFPRFPDLFGLSWETSTFKHYHPEDSKH